MALVYAKYVKMCDSNNESWMLSEGEFRRFWWRWKWKQRKLFRQQRQWKFCKDIFLQLGKSWWSVIKAVNQYWYCRFDRVLEWDSYQLKSHIHFKRRQVGSYNKVKDKLSYDEIIMHVDYIENYKSAHQDEIQSAHFEHTSFSIFNAWCYYWNRLNDGLENVPVITTSESSDHSHIAAFSCINMLVKHIQAKLKPEKLKVFIWSEGCASPFRSKFIFMLMTYFDKAVDIEWYYNES